MFGARPIRIENGNRRFRLDPTGDIGVSRFCTRVLFRTAANYHGRTANGRPYGSTILEHRIIVGASIARPPGCQIFGLYDHFATEICRLSLFRIKTILSPFYWVAIDVFPYFQVISFAANHMVVKQLLPNRMTYLLGYISLHLLNNG